MNDCHVKSLSLQFNDHSISHSLLSFGVDVDVYVCGCNGLLWEKGAELFKEEKEIHIR